MPPLLKTKGNLRENILVTSLRQNVSLSILKWLLCWKICNCVLDVWFSFKKHQRKRIYCSQKHNQINIFKKKFSMCSQIGSFRIRNSKANAESFFNPSQKICFKIRASQKKPQRSFHMKIEYEFVCGFEETYHCFSFSKEHHPSLYIP